MDEEPKKKQPGNETPGNDDFNRTVVINKPERRNSGSHATPLHKIATRFVRKKQEVDDIIGRMNISNYTNAEPDTSAQLTAPLSNLDTRYSVLEEFAKGGHATVSIARDKNLRRIVAIKSLKKEAEKNAEIVDSFVSEAKVTAQLDHPAIIPIYGLTGDGQNGVHLSMKLVNGKTLRDYLRNLTLNYRIKGIKTFDETVLLRKRLEIFLRVCDAISYAHHRNIMHRDLKPENIMIGEYMEVYVMDWGLAKAIPKEEDSPENNAKVTGTPRYFSPEALRGERCDARSDIFTLGLILQEIVTLQFAIKGSTEKEYMEHIVNGELEPIEHLFKWKIDKQLQAIIRKATAYRPEDRYQTADDLAEDLRRHMGGLSVSAYPDSTFMKIARYANRYRQQFLLGFMAILFGSAALTAYTIYRQSQAVEAMNMQKRAINFIYDRIGIVSEHLDMTTLHIQEQLSALSRISAYLLSYNTASKGNEWTAAFRPSMGKIGKTEPGMFYSPYYKRLISLDYGIYTTAPNSDSAKTEEFIRKIYPVLTKMKIIVLGNKSGYRFAPKDYEKLKTEYLYQGSPIRAVFIGSTEGVKLLYPWRGNYSREVDPRRRSWYKNALQKNVPYWGKPYMDIDSVSGLSIPCSVPIYNLSGEFCGVAGLDLSVNRLTNSILQKGNTGDYVIEKAVINLNGETIFSTKSQYFNKRFDPEKYHQNVEFETPLFQTAEIRNRILKKQSRGYGTFIINQNGKEIICSYAYLTVLNMYFAVVADYRKLIQYIKNNNL